MKTPEELATERFNQGRAEYAQVQSEALEVISIREPIRFGLVVKELGTKGFNGHIIMQATDDLIGHGVHQSALDMLTLTELGRERLATS